MMWKLTWHEGFVKLIEIIFSEFLSYVTNLLPYSIQSDVRLIQNLFNIGYTVVQFQIKEIIFLFSQQIFCYLVEDYVRIRDVPDYQPPKKTKVPCSEIMSNKKP